MKIALLIILSALISAVIYTYTSSQSNSTSVEGGRFPSINVPKPRFRACSVKNTAVPILHVPNQTTYTPGENYNSTTSYKVKCTNTKSLELRPYVGAIIKDKDWYISGTIMVNVILKINDTPVTLTSNRTISYGSKVGNGQMTVIDNVTRVKASHGQVFSLEVNIILNENATLAIDNSVLGFIINEL